MIYAIIPLELNDEPSFKLRLETFEREKVPVYNSYTQVYFIDFNGTSKQVAEAVGFSSTEEVGSGVVLGITSYWGFAGKDLWEWLDLYSK